MKIIITESQISKLALSYLGPLKKSSEDGFDVWKNKEGIVVFKTSDYKDLHFNKKILDDIHDMFTLNMEEFFNLLVDVSIKLMGKRANSFPLF